MIKYYIDTSSKGILKKAKSSTDADGNESITNGETKLDFDIKVNVINSNTFKTFCESVLLDGEPILYYNEIRDGATFVIIPANTTIENSNKTTSFYFCKVVPYQTE